MSWQIKHKVKSILKKGGIEIHRISGKKKIQITGEKTCRLFLMTHLQHLHMSRLAGEPPFDAL